MTWTNQQLIDQAYAEIGIAPYVYALTSNQSSNALLRLADMIAAWSVRGIDLGYIAGSGLNDDSGISDGAAEPIYLNLAVRLAPSLGKTVNPATIYTARTAYEGLLLAVAAPPEMVSCFPWSGPDCCGSRDAAGVPGPQGPPGPAGPQGPPGDPYVPPTYVIPPGPLCIEIDPVAPGLEAELYSHFYISLELGGSVASSGFPGRYTRLIEGGIAIAVNGDRTTINGQQEIDASTGKFIIVLLGGTNSDSVANIEGPVDPAFPRLQNLGRSPYEIFGVLNGYSALSAVTLEVFNRNGWNSIVPPANPPVQPDDYSYQTGAIIACPALLPSLIAARAATGL